MKITSGQPLLLHVCCAPCAAGCVERLIATGRPLTLYYSNSNLNSAEEFDRRLNAVEVLAAAFNLPLEVDPYRHDQWLVHVAGLEDEPERGRRCPRCFDWSLRRTAHRAAEYGAAFATTLTVSPHKPSALLFEIGAAYPGFEAWDFKKQDGFRRGSVVAGELDLYRQNYCGCEFSLRRPQP